MHHLSVSGLCIANIRVLIFPQPLFWKLAELESPFCLLLWNVIGRSPLTHCAGYSMGTLSLATHILFFEKFFSVILLLPPLHFFTFRMLKLLDNCSNIFFSLMLYSFSPLLLLLEIIQLLNSNSPIFSKECALLGCQQSNEFLGSTPSVLPSLTNKLLLSS